ncbi:GDP-mannose 4,6-dehydratase [Geodermatophilus sp. FMUSA9-8]|uniref:GDP-mannose 4,6-dehydratase n=1 Tax=Geodermatophilus sp. FMUSA9-8 TaxID=3120155 RepID=UPI003008D4D1
MALALVTGIGGQDGGYLAEQLVAAGHRVHGTVSGGAGGPLPAHLAALGDALTVHTADLRDPGALPGLVDEVAPDWVFNLAGASSVAASWADPVGTLDVNGRAVLALLEHLLRRAEEGAEVRLVQASSGEVFAGATGGPVTEASPVSPVNPYGVAKAVAHRSVGMYRERGLHASSLVLFNHESPRRPERFVTRKITRGVAAIAAGRADRLVLGNLDVRRDWGWAPDYTAAMLLAAEAPEAGDYVVATGVAHSLRDLVAAAFAEVGVADWEPLLASDPGLVRPADAEVLVGDPSRLRERLGWAPTVGFEEMVATMVRTDLAELSADEGETRR